MTNFFDIATAEEVRQHFTHTETEGLALLRQDFARDADRNNGYLASLFHMRGDEGKTEEYLNKINDDACRRDFATSFYELIEA